MSTFDLVGTPYKFPPEPPVSFDCWTLLLYVREHLGLGTPLPVDPSDYDLGNMEEAIAAVRPVWRRVEVPDDGDAVLFDQSHIGVALGAGVLHAHAPARAVVFTRWTVLKRRWPHFEVWRP